MSETTGPFYRIIDSDDQSRWYLDEPLGGEGQEIDFWPLITGRQVQLSDYPRLHFPVQAAGTELDFTLALFDIPVVRKEVAAKIEEVVGGEVQRLPVGVNGTLNEFEILVVPKRFNCIDMDQSDYELWGEEDGRPDKVGEIRMLVDWKIDLKKVPVNCDIFRVEGWETAMIVSATLKRVLEDLKVTGIEFEEH